MSRNQAWLLMLALLLSYIVPLGVRPLLMPDEIRYAEISREMIATGDWVVPRLLGLQYFEKPVGGYWVGNLSQLVFGASNFAVRLPSALATAVTALLVGWLAWSGSRDRRKGWLAAAIYLSSFMVFGIGTTAVLDPMLVMWLTAALCAFWKAFGASGQRARFGWWSLFGALCGGAFLVKGFVALAVPVVAIAPLMLWHRRWRELVGYGSWSVIVAAAVAAPWGLMVHERASDYWRYFFWEEHIRRFAGDDPQHPQPIWFYVPFLFTMALPWVGAVPEALRGGWVRAVRGSSAFDRLMVLALVMPLLFFSIAKGKLVTYILPCFAPFAVLLANAVVDEVDRARKRSLHWSVLLHLVVSCVLLVALLGAIVFQPDDPYVAGQGQAELAFGLCLAVWIAILGFVLRRGTGHVTALLLLMPTLVMALPFLWAHPLVKAWMPQEFVQSVFRALPADCALASASVKLSPLLAWETGRTDVVIVGGGGELSYGLKQAEGRNRMFDEEEFSAWLSAERRRRHVALFAIRANTLHLEKLPPPDFTDRSGKLLVLHYNRRDD